jgi:hypothetical protein
MGEYFLQDEQITILIFAHMENTLNCGEKTIRTEHISGGTAIN